MKIFNYDGYGVYKISNTVSGKCYIGISKHCNQRVSQHISMLRRGKHDNHHLQRAWDKYGEESFTFSLIEKFDMNEVDKEHVLLREIYWIDFYDSYRHGYNQSKGGDGSPFVQFSEERNKKISESSRGRKQPWNTREKSFNARHIICLNTRKEYFCIADAEEEYKISCASIIRSCQSRNALSNKCYHVFMYYEDFLELSENDIEQIIRSAKYKKEHKWDGMAESVVCVNTGEVFVSGRLAAEQYKTDYSRIRKCCKGEYHSAGKSETGEPLAWMSLKDYDSASKEEIAYKLRDALLMGNRNKPVRVKCLTTGERFENMATASKAYGISQVSLARKLKVDGVCGIHPITKEKLKWKVIS